MSYMPNVVADHVPGADKLKAKGMVMSAVQVHLDHGAKAALQTVQNHDHFADGDYYVFVLDATTYKQLASGGFPERNGQSMLNLKTPDGKDLRHLVDDATTDGVWLRWNYYNPVTRVGQAKEGWLIRVENHVYGAGVYLDEE